MIGILQNGNTSVYFRVPVSAQRVVPAVYRIELPAGERWNLGGIDFSKCSPAVEQPSKWHEAVSGSAFWPEGAIIESAPHWSDIAMVNLAHEQYAKILSSDTPSKLALLAVTDIQLFREFDRRRKNWGQDLMILAQCLRWEETKSSMAERYADCEKLGVTAGANASNGSAWLQERLKRLKNRLASCQ